MFYLDGAPLMVHALLNVLLLGLMLFACIGAFVKKQRFLGLGLLILSLSGFLWAGSTTYPILLSELSKASPSLYTWFMPLLNLLQAAGWGCLVISVFKLPKSD